MPGRAVEIEVPTGPIDRHTEGRGRTRHRAQGTRWVDVPALGPRRSIEAERVTREVDGDTERRRRAGHRERSPFRRVEQLRPLPSWAPRSGQGCGRGRGSD